MLVFEWAFFVVLLLFCLLCGTAGVLCAACCVRPGCSVRPPSTAHDLPSSVWSLCVPVGGGPPARSPHASLTARSGRSRGPPWPCRHPPAPRPGPPVPPEPSTPVGPDRCSAALRVVSKPGQAPPPPTGTTARPTPSPSPRMPSPRPRPSRPSFVNPHPISHAIPSRLFQTLNSDRWNCNVFRLC